MKPLFLGVDGGQTSTVALIGDASGALVGRGVGGPSNHVGAEEGRARLMQAVKDSLTDACRDAGLSYDALEFDAACLGFTGGPGDKETILRDMLRATRLALKNDAEIALSGALDGGPGVIVIAGTGSIAFGRNRQGTTGRAGGWGYLFGDEGGGFDLVRQALRASLRYEEGWGPPTVLHRLLREATAFSDIRDVQRRFYTTEFPRHRVAGYSTLVDRAAHEGDEVATGILVEAARFLAHLGGVVIKQIFVPGEPATLTYAGGVFESAPLLEAFTRAAPVEGFTAVTAPRHEPAMGALIEAYRLAGLDGIPALTARP